MIVHDIIPSCVAEEHIERTPPSAKEKIDKKLAPYLVGSESDLLD